MSMPQLALWNRASAQQIPGTNGEAKNEMCDNVWLVWLPWIRHSQRHTPIHSPRARHMPLAARRWLLSPRHLWSPGHHDTRHTDASLPTVTAYIRNQRRAGGLEP